MNKGRYIALLLTAFVLVACCALASAPESPANNDTDLAELTFPFELEEATEETQAPSETPKSTAPPQTEPTAAPQRPTLQEPPTTPRPTLPPEGPYAVLIASLREAVGQGHITMSRALEGWLVSRVKTVEGGLEVAFPMFTETKESLPKYEGEEPSAYLQTVTQQLAEQIMLLPIDADIDRITASDSQEPDEQLVEMLVQIGEEMEIWIHDQLTRAGAYGALTRLAFEIGDMNSTYWPHVRFDAKDQAPQHGMSISRKTLEQGDTGPTIRASQEALIDQGFLDASRATGTYTEQMKKAVQLFEAENGFEVDGRLDPEERYLLLGEAPPFTLPGVVAEAWDRQEDFATWWPWLVYKLESITWNGSTATVVYRDYLPYEDDLSMYCIQLCMASEIGVDQLELALVYSLGFVDEMENVQTKEVSFSVTLDALRNANGAGALTAANQEKMMELFNSFYYPVGEMALVLPTLLSFMQEETP